MVPKQPHPSFLAPHPANKALSISFIITDLIPKNRDNFYKVRVL